MQIHPSFIKQYMKCLPHHRQEPKSTKQVGPWMLYLKNQLISEITIPGTHDSCCNIETSGILQTQTWSLLDQLNAGIRFLDIRCRHINNDFEIYHDKVSCETTFTKVLYECKSFLTKYPSEGILMRIKEEHIPENNSRSFQETFIEKIKDYTDIIHFEKKIPLLNLIRGKIFIFRIFQYDYGYAMINAKIQDEYYVESKDYIDIKKEKIKTHIFSCLFKQGSDELFINFCSGTGPEVWPIALSKKTNKVPLNYKGKMGIILFDFPGEDVIKHLIDQNPIYYQSPFCLFINLLIFSQEEGTNNSIFLQEDKSEEILIEQNVWCGKVYV